jgi:peptidyl-prolyl cis-trans isomerase SurA
MKYYFLAFYFFSLFLHAEINFIDRIAIIVDDGIIMESELNEALENTISNFEESGERLPPREIIFSRVIEKLIMDTVTKSREVWRQN